MTDDTNTRYVTCATCGADYPTYDWGDANQGSGCAAMLFDHKDGKRYLSGGYGSTVCDMTEYLVIPHDHFKLGDCCDICIVEMIASDLAKEIPYRGWYDDTETV